MTHSETPARPWDVALIVGLTLLAFAPSLLTRDPWNPDEPRYIEVAREMVVTGQYLVPHLNGLVYPDKPAPVFWLFAGFYRLGFGLQAGRVVALLAAAGTLLLVYALGRRMASRDVGLLGALGTLTSFLFLYICNWGVLDPPLMFLNVLSIFCGIGALHAGESGRVGRWWLGCYAAIGAGILVKGPVALATPGLVLLAYGLAHRREVRGGGWWHLAGAGLMLAIVAAWLVPACIEGGEEYTNNIVFQQTLRRVAKSDSHRQPPWFYVKQSPGYFFPWTLLLVLALAWSVLRVKREGRAALGLPLLWFAVLLVFFSAVSGKRERYLLPIMPAAGLLCAQYLLAVADGRKRAAGAHRWLWRVTFVLMAILGGVLLATGVLPMRWTQSLRLSDADRAILQEAVTPAARVAAGLAGALVLAFTFRGARRRHDAVGERGRARALVGATLALMLGIQLAGMPVLNRFKSGRYFVQQARPYLENAERVYLHESDLSGVYNLFTGRVHMEIIPAGELAQALGTRDRVAVIAREEQKGEMHRLVRGTWGDIAVRRRVGGHFAFLIINWRPNDAH